MPVYQRAYAWKKPNVKDLFDDLDRALRESGKDYFLGSVVACTTSDDALEIVDGQQRFATTAILLAAIRDHLLGLNEKSAAEYVDSYLQRTEGIKSPKVLISLSLSEADNEFFRKRILALPGSPDRDIRPTRESHRRMVDAANLAGQHVRSITGDRKVPDQMAILDSWVEFIRDKAQVIFITVPDHSDAFVIFETLNDRGLELSIADLTKNHIFGRSGKRIEEAKHNWSRMTGILEAVSNTDISKFYIHLTCSPIADPRGMRVVAARKGKETLDVDEAKEATQPRADRSEAA